VQFMTPTVPVEAYSTVKLKKNIYWKTCPGRNTYYGKFPRIKMVHWDIHFS